MKNQILFSALTILAWAHTLDAQHQLHIDHAPGNGVLIQRPQVVGLTIDSAQQGAVITNSAGQGIILKHSGEVGIQVDSSDLDGIQVNRAGSNGITIDRTQENGILIEHSDMAGVRISGPDENGILIETPGQSGVEVLSAGQVGFRTANSEGNGVEVRGSGNHGVFVEDVTFDGLNVLNPTRYGVNVFEATVGVQIGHSSSDGINIHNSGKHGVKIIDSDEHGIQVADSGEDGIQVVDSDGFGVAIGRSGASGIGIVNSDVNGIYIDSSGADGIVIDHSNDDGLRILNSVDDGIDVINSGNDGIHVNGAAGSAGIFINDPASTSPAVLTSHANDDLSDLKLSGYGRIASDSHLDIHLDDQDAHNAFFRVRSSTGGVPLALNENGHLTIQGNIAKAGGSFKIDHPLDPTNKYLYHSFVESPDMMNIYNGNVTLDENGRATIEMPDWFEALNRDFRYQLTPIGAAADLFIEEEISNRSFKIAGGEPGMKVSWMVTGIRHDPYANAHRIPLEVDKEAEKKGTYLHPQVYQKINHNRKDTQ